MAGMKAHSVPTTQAMLQTDPRNSPLMQSNFMSEDVKTEYGDARFRLRCTDMMQTDVFTSSEPSHEREQQQSNDNESSPMNKK